MIYKETSRQIVFLYLGTGDSGHAQALWAWREGGEERREKNGGRGKEETGWREDRYKLSHPSSPHSSEVEMSEDDNM